MEDVTSTFWGFTRVKNVKNSEGREPPSGFDYWIDVWEYFCNNDKKYSGVCYRCWWNEGIGGGHLKEEGNGPEWIMPLCAKCNHYSNQDYFRPIFSLAVRANVSELKEALKEEDSD